MIDKIKQEKEMKRLTTLIALLALAFGLGATTANAGDTTDQFSMSIGSEYNNTPLMDGRAPKIKDTTSTTVIIGDGTNRQREPFGVEYAYERSATLYTADQINAIGTIEMLAWDCGRDYHPRVAYKIWLKNTSDTIMTVKTWQAMTADMVMVKEGSFTGDGEGWKIFQLETPFEYTGANLIVGVETSGNHHYLFGGAYNYTNVAFSRHQSWAGNDPPSGNGFVNDRIPNIMMQLSPNSISDDICAIQVSGNQVPIVGSASEYTVNVRNNGDNMQANYQVKLIGTNEVELAVVNGPAVDSGEIVEVVIPWTPTAAGEMSIYAKIEMPGDELAQNNQTAPLLLDIQPEHIQVASVGSGSGLVHYPMDFRWGYSVYETIYLAGEMGFTSGIINSLAFCNHFHEDRLNEPTIIFMGSTDRTDLSEGFIPASEMALVFDGAVDYPRGDNAVLFHLRTPYMYTGGNMVVMFCRPENIHSYYNSPFYYRGQLLDDNRSRYLNRVAFPIDPYNISGGALTREFPQVTFLYTVGSVANDLGIWNLRGDSKLVVGNSYNYTVNIRNNGMVDQNNYQVKLTGPDDVVLAAVEGPPIGSMQSLELDLSWTPATLGATTIYAKVELNGDEYVANDSTEGLEIKVYPLGVEDVVAALNDAGDTVELTWAEQVRSYGSEDDDDYSRSPADRTTPALVGYMVYRLSRAAMHQEDRWVNVTQEPIAELSVSDPLWLALPDGPYCWAVKAIYSEGIVSLPSFSNVIYRGVASGRIEGYVLTSDNQHLEGATVNNGALSTTTDNGGYFSLRVPVGSYTVTASYPGYASQSVENVIVPSVNDMPLVFRLTSLTNDDPQIPVAATALKGNYPNPFNPETTISYSVMKPGRVKLDIYNIKGQLVRTLVDEDHATGHYKKLFDGKDNGGRSLASGVYLIMMNAPGYQKASKMMLMK